MRYYLLRAELMLGLHCSPDTNTHSIILHMYHSQFVVDIDTLHIAHNKNTM